MVSPPFSTSLASPPPPPGCLGLARGSEGGWDLKHPPSPSSLLGGIHGCFGFAPPPSSASSFGGGEGGGEEGQKIEQELRLLPSPPPSFLFSSDLRLQPLSFLVFLPPPPEVSLCRSSAAKVVEENPEGYISRENLFYPSPSLISPFLDLMYVRLFFA